MFQIMPTVQRDVRAFDGPRALFASLTIAEAFFTPYHCFSRQTAIYNDNSRIETNFRRIWLEIIVFRACDEIRVPGRMFGALQDILRDVGLREIGHWIAAWFKE